MGLPRGKSEGDALEIVLGAYHLHGKPRNSSWKIKWCASFNYCTSSLRASSLGGGDGRGKTFPLLPPTPKRACSQANVLLKLCASGQSDASLLLLLGFTADVHTCTFCMLFIFCLDKLNHNFSYLWRKFPSGWFV